MSQLGRGPRRSGAATPAIAALLAAGVEFAVHEFDHDSTQRGFGLEAAAALAARLGVEPDPVFKTLLVELTDAGGATRHAVGIVPVTLSLSLREVAGVFGAKRAEMCAPAVAERLTGGVVGGISPFGQKRRLPTAIDETCELWDSVFVSGGRRGLDLELAPADLVAVVDAAVAAIAVP
jgi:Cys-tRNA(Pro)/Cys-tRNA(Cys) deacylase